MSVLRCICIFFVRATRTFRSVYDRSAESVFNSQRCPRHRAADIIALLGVVVGEDGFRAFFF